jgi:predicted PurR-regulated permease PerM
VQTFINNQRGRAISLSTSALGVLFQLLSVSLFTFYLVADGPKMRRAICSRLPEAKQRTVLKTWDLAIEKTGGYLYSRALLALISAFFHWIAFQAIGTPAPVAMALWVGIVSQFLPVVGTYLVYQQLENYLFAPRITARTLKVHAAVAFGAAMVGGAVLGPLGAVMALPASAMVQALASSWGTRHDVIDDELVRVVEKPVRQKRARRKS